MVKSAVLQKTNAPEKGATAMSKEIAASKTGAEKAQSLMSK